ncbi:unnamed protein product [Trichobilharzia szidati]|nr:unnamed protein product [Trichobilharzia szidati]
MNNFSMDMIQVEGSTKNLSKTLTSTSISYLGDHKQKQYLTMSSILASNSLPNLPPNSNCPTLINQELSLQNASDSTATTVSNNNNSNNSGANHSNVISQSGWSGTLTNCSEIHTANDNHYDEGQELCETANHQNISKLEDILAGMSLSTFVEPIKSNESNVKEGGSLERNSLAPENDENSPHQLHPIFMDKSWAQSLFNESKIFSDEFKENPEKILDDHFNRIWKKREAQMLLEDRISQLTDDKKYSRRRNNKGCKRVNIHQRNITDEEKERNFKGSRHSLLKHQINCNRQNHRFNGNSTEEYGAVNHSRELFSEYLVRSSQHLLSFINNNNNNNRNNTDDNLNKLNYQHYDICDNYNNDNNTNNDIESMRNIGEHNLTKPNEIIHETIHGVDGSALTTYVKTESYEKKAQRSHLKRRHSYFEYSAGTKSSDDDDDDNDNTIRQRCDSTQSLSISLFNMTDNTVNCLQKNSVIIVVYILEDTLPYIILCKDEQWRLKALKQIIIHELYSNKQKLRNKVNDELQVFNQRFYFKTESDEFDSKAVYQEVTDDNEDIPLWKNLIWVKIEDGHSY